MEEQISGMFEFYLPILYTNLVPRRPDSEQCFPVPAEGYVAVFLGFPSEVAVPLPNWLGECWYSVCVGVYIVPEKQARCRGGFQNSLLVLDHSSPQPESVNEG